MDGFEKYQNFKFHSPDTSFSELYFFKNCTRLSEDLGQHTGEINLSGRKLKEYPKVGAKYDLADSTVTGRL